MAMAVLNVPSTSALSYVATAFAILLLARIVYRLTLHPLATFPGPKLAAITSLYGAFYDLSFSSSSYVKELPALHAKYGPIVRAWPNELHFHDLEAYNQIFKAGTKFPKERRYYTSYTPLNGSFFSIQDPKEAMARRNLFSAYLSRDAIRRAEPLVQSLCCKFLGILHSAASKEKGDVVNLSKGFRGLTADVIMTFTFNKPLGALDAPGFDFNVTNALSDGAVVGQWSAYFPSVFRISLQAIDKLPFWFIDKYMEPLALTKLLLRISRERILELDARPTTCPDQLPTIFDTALRPNVGKGQIRPTIDQLSADSLLLLEAGTITTAHALIIATYNVLRDPRILTKLQVELKEAIPRKGLWLEWAELEKLPYLSGVIKESLRGSSGTPGHLPRLVPSTGAVLCGQRIPPGTIVSSSAHLYHHDPITFPDPECYRPERWLVNDKEFSELEKNMMPFSRGTRQCPGQNLAYQELHLALAHLFRRFDMTLHETTDADMDWKDCTAVHTMGDLKVKIREAKD